MAKDQLSIIENTLNQLLKLSSENEVVEFKEAKRNFDFNKLGKYFSALSNEANLSGLPYSWLIFGVSDKEHKIVGTSYRQNAGELELLKKEIADKTSNRLTFTNIFEVQKSEGRVLMFQIPAAIQGSPTGFDGLLYAREGESLAGLNLLKIETILRQKKHHDWSAEIVENATIEDLDPKAIAEARILYSEKNSDKVDEIKTWSDKVFLNKAKITIGGKITNTSIVLLGKEESELLLTPSIVRIRWILRGIDNVERDYYFASCPLILTSKISRDKIRNLKYRYINIGKNTLFPEEIDTYDPYVIREALHNAIAHQDYSLAGMINVVEYDDHIVITNPGSFIPGDLNNVIKNDAPTEFYRNNFLVRAMVNLKMVDTIGSGIRKMCEIQKKRFFPLPDWQIENNRVTVTIWGKVIDLNYSALLATQNISFDDTFLLNRVQQKHSLSEEEVIYLRKKHWVVGHKDNLMITFKDPKKSGKEITEIKKTFEKSTRKNVTENVTENVIENVIENRLHTLIKIIKENPDISTKELSQRMNVARRTIARDIAKLKQQGLISRIGPDKGGYWQVNEIIVK